MTLSPERIAELRRTFPYRYTVRGDREMWAVLDAYELLAAQRDRYEAAMREIAQYTCHNEESRIVRDIARRAIEGDTK
jgi:hypothetical protein